MERERLEQAEHCAQLLVDRGGPIILEDEFYAAVTKRQLRDRGVGLSSEDALIESGDESGERLALANRPRGWSAHDLLRQLRKRAAKELFSVKERSHYAWRVARHHSHDGENRLLAEAMPSVDFLQPHALSNALRPANSRFRDAPSAALTTISNILSSPYFAWARAMSSSVTL